MGSDLISELEHRESIIFEIESLELILDIG
jgi:hypothetical protein